MSILIKEIELSGGGWDVVHQSNKIRHEICFQCGAIIKCKNQLPKTYGWVIHGKDTKQSRRRNAYACQPCYGIIADHGNRI